VVIPISSIILRGTSFIGTVPAISFVVIILAVIADGAVAAAVAGESDG
jgi:hypothetical protein